MSNKALGVGAFALVAIIISIGFWSEISGQIKRLRTLAAAGASNGGEVVKIGGVFALSGGGAYWGQDEMRAAQLAIDEANAEGGINGRQIKFIVEDAPATENNSKGVSAFQKLINVDQVSAIIGPTWDPVAQATAPLADQTKTVIVSPSTSSGTEMESDYKFLFSTALPEREEMLRLNEFAKKNGWNRLGVIRNKDPFSETMTSKLKETGEALGVRVVSEIQVIAATEFRTEITRLKKESIDAVYVVFVDEASKCPFLKQAKELNLDKPIISNFSTESPDSLNECADVLQGVHYSYQKQGSAYTELVKKYEAAYDMQPTSPATANAYDATWIVVTAMRNGHLSGDDLRDELLRLRDFSGASGDGISFSENGYFVVPAANFVIKTVRNGEFVVVE